MRKVLPSFGGTDGPSIRVEYVDIFSSDPDQWTRHQRQCEQGARYLEAVRKGVERRANARIVKALDDA